MSFRVLFSSPAKNSFSTKTPNSSPSLSAFWTSHPEAGIEPSLNPYALQRYNQHDPLNSIHRNGNHAPQAFPLNESAD